MPREPAIENRVILNREQFGYPDSIYIRRCRAGRGYGIADVVLLPVKGPHKLVIVEAKQITSVDAASKVIGQLMLYYAGFLQFGLRGIRLMRVYATAYPDKARNKKPKMLKTLSGGISPPEAAWKEMKKGRKIHPEQIGLYIALDATPSTGLKASLTVLSEQHDLSIGVLSVPRRDELKVWTPK